MQQLDRWKRVVPFGMALVLSSVATSVFAADSQDLTQMVGNVKKQADAIATLMNVAAYIAGVAFALAGILQFKAHKENPQNTPLSKPIVLIVVAACLLFLPTILSTAGQSLFGGGQKASQYTGELGGG